MEVSWPSTWVSTVLVFGVVAVTTLEEVAGGSGFPWLSIAIGLAVIGLCRGADWVMQARSVEGKTRLAWVVASAVLLAGLSGVVVLAGTGVQATGYLGRAFVGLCLASLVGRTVVPSGYRVLDAE